jgi:hypothetical protein
MTVGLGVGQAIIAGYVAQDVIGQVRPASTTNTPRLMEYGGIDRPGVAPVHAGLTSVNLVDRR